MQNEINEMSAIYSRRELAAIIKRERAVADRIGSRLTLVLFTVGSGSLKTYSAALIDRIRQRVRASDYPGWFDRKRIGVLLPDTNREGAVSFACAVAAEDPAAEMCPVFRVLEYPEERKTDTGFALTTEELQTVFVRRMPLWKRALDIAGSLTALIMLSPLMIFIAVYIKLVSPGPVFFRQKRVGYKGRIFTFLKFRTMHVNNDVSSHQSHLRELIRSNTPMEKLDNKNDPRIIPGGSVIRKASLDELPQFLNVLRGDMSLVGPRPCIPYEAEEYLRWHTHRFDTYPGISGLWQVSGKNRLSFKEMVRLDIAYANHLSIRLDLSIIFRTVPTIIGMALERPKSRPRGGKSPGTRTA